MNQTNFVNQEVNIVAYYFKNDKRRLHCFPRRMEYDGKRVDFTETGLVHPADRTDSGTDFFKMSDGSSDYQLEFNPADLSWKLIAITNQRHEPTFRQFAVA